MWGCYLYQGQLSHQNTLNVRIEQGIIQTFDVFLNGYDIFDPYRKDDTFQANKPQFISNFAENVAFNSFGAGFLWLFYGLN